MAQLMEIHHPPEGPHTHTIDTLHLKLVGEAEK